MPAAITKTVQEKFKEWYIPEPNSNCWIWIGTLNSDGYGRFYYSVNKGKEVSYFSAHRISYELYKGWIDEELELDHLCRIRSCVNPDHLEAVTHAENIKRGRTGKHYSERTHCKRGHFLDDKNVRVNIDSKGHPIRRCCRCEEDLFKKRQITPEFKERRRVYLKEYYQKKRLKEFLEE